MTTGNHLDIHPPVTAESSRRDDDIHFSEILGYLLDAKWTIIPFVVVALLISAFHAYMAIPVYHTDALLQIERNDQSLPGLDSAAQVFSGFYSGQSVIDTIQSRRVIGDAVDKLHLTINVWPRYFPYIGYVMAHRYRGKGLAKPFLGLDEYAWGGEVLTLDHFDITGDLAADNNASWLLVAGENQHYTLIHGEQQVLSGIVGEPVTADYQGLRIKIQVSELTAHPGMSFTISRSSRISTIEAIKPQIHVSQSAGEMDYNESGMITVSMEGSDPRYIVDVVNAVTQAYVQSSREKQAIAAAQKLDFIDGQLPMLEAKQNEAALALQQFQQKEESIDLSLEIQNIVTQLEEIKNEITTLQLKKESMQLSYTDEHPQMKALNLQITASKKIKLKLEQLLKKLPEKEWTYLKKSRDLEASTELYMSMLKTAQELRISKAGMTGNALIIDPAIIRPGTMTTRKGTTLLTGLLAGLLLGIAWVLIKRMLHRGVDDPVRLERETGFPVFATIPHSDNQQRFDSHLRKAGKRNDHTGIKLLAYEHSDDLAIEALRSFRINMRFALKTAENNLVIISSPSPSVGKSFFAANYAAVSSKVGHRVLLIDADMRKGHLYQHMGEAKTPGLSDLIVGDLTLDQAMHALTDDLYFLSCGKTPPNPSELLETAAFQSLLEEANEKFDLVIIDTPPILAVADASIIAHYGGSLFVLLRSGQHHINEIQHVISIIKKGGAKVTGLLINDQKVQSAAYGYRYQYTYK